MLNRRTALLAGLSAVASGCSRFLPQDQGDRLVFTFWGSSFEKDAVTAACRRIESTHRGLDIDPQHIDGDAYPTKVNTLIAAKTPPDVAYLAEGMAMRLASEGKLANVLDYRDEHPDLRDLLPSTVHEWAPGKAITQIAIEMPLLWYNRDLFDEAGVPAPPITAATAWTWDEYVEAADKLTFDQDGRRPSESGFDPDNVAQYGCNAPIFSPWLYNQLRSNDADMFNDDGTGCVLDSDAAVEVLYQLWALMYEHRVAPSPTQFNQLSMSNANLLKTGRVAMAIDGHWVLLDLGQLDFPYGVGVLPKFQEALATVTCAPMVVFAASNHRAAAMELLVLLMNPDVVPMYADGLWMPQQRRYYTDPAQIAKWTQNDVHPKGFKEAAIDMMLDHAVSWPSYELKNFDKVSAEFAALDPLWQGKQSGRDGARAVAKDAVARINPLLQGKFTKAST